MEIGKKTIDKINKIIKNIKYKLWQSVKPRFNQLTDQYRLVRKLLVLNRTDIRRFGLQFLLKKTTVG
jgi:hypothetical protein